MSAVMWRVARFLTLGTLLVAGSASGQMIPLEDLRHSSVHVVYQGDTEDYQERYPPASFAFWEDMCVGAAEKYEPCVDPPPDQCLVGECTGTAYQISEFFPAGIQFSGATGASWGVPPSGVYLINATAGFKFKIDDTFDFDLFCIVDPGDSPVFDGGIYSGAVQLVVYNSAGASTIVHYLQDGQLQVTGRLGPGTYELKGWSGKFGAWESFQGPAFSAQWTVQKPQAPAIGIQPSDHSTACGGTAVFSVGTALPQSGYTFQWRKNFVPLTDGPGVSGATTSTLTLTNVCSADDYDVVVTGPNPAGGGTISEPSRLAHLNIITTPTGVDAEPTTTPAPAVGAPAPNPFRVSTAVAYETPKPARLVAAVYSASGALVRTLVDRTVSGAGSVTWDGRLRSGVRAPVGIYFLRVELDGLHQTRKVVLVE